MYNRGVEAMDYSYALMDLTVYGRQEPGEDSPPGWPQEWGLLRHSDDEKIGSMDAHSPLATARRRTPDQLAKDY